MQSTNLAEWFLRRTTTPDHASAQLGDLLELRQTRGTLWFWRSILAYVAYSAARPTIAFLAAYLSCEAVASAWAGTRLTHPLSVFYIQFRGYIFTAVPAAISVFAFFRFGSRDAYARITLLFTVLASLLLIGSTNSTLRWTFPLLAAVVLVTLFLKRSIRPILLRSFAQIASAIVISQLGMALIRAYLRISLGVLLQNPSSYGATAQSILLFCCGAIHDLLYLAVFFLMIQTTGLWRMPQPSTISHA